MNMLLLPRQYGKTTRLIEIVKLDKELVLFVISERERRRIINENQDFRVDTETTCCSFGDRIKEVGRDVLIGQAQKAVVDNVDMILEDLIRGRVVMGSATK